MSAEQKSFKTTVLKLAAIYSSADGLSFGDGVCHEDDRNHT